MSEKIVFLIEDESEGERLDLYLANEIVGKSRSFIQKLIGEGNVTLGGKPIKASYKLKPEDEIEVIMPEVMPLDIVGEEIALDILYEDRDIIVVNKPQDMVVHPSAGHYSGTLVNALMYHCGHDLSGINGMLRPGIVHRIDKDTSGVLIVAKNDNAHQKLCKQFADHSIKRKYIAIAQGNIKAEEFTIEGAIGRNPKDRKKMAINEKNGKSAITHIRVLERYRGYTYFEAGLETGRTHQIRVHMASKGYPILGDLVYGAKKQPFKLQGQALHAKTLGFIHPTTGEYMEFNAEPPVYFNDLLNKLKNL